ncbi:hypothetical protein GJ496_010139 [Pomphorhynchus laevis]|nr:hypothetical protein GJ496_010139 [Pomphorhynchus laevis]
MNFSMSKSEVQKRSKTSEKNSRLFWEGPKRSLSLHIEMTSLSAFTRRPLKSQICGRYRHLADMEKCRRKRVLVLTDEVIKLWEKCNLPILSKCRIVIKQCFDPLKSIFDITNQSGTWLSSEDKQFYESQVESKGKLGYCSTREGSIHPSKLIRKSENKIAEMASEFEVKKRKYESTDQVKALTTRCSLSSRKASDVCVTLAKCGVLRIDVLFLNDGKAETIVNGIVESLKEYGIMKSIKMIVSDTTSVNVGWKNGIVTRLQSRLRNETNEVPQFIGCQYHIQHRALRIIMHEYFGKYTVSPEISYEFVSLLTKDYDKLKHDFEQGGFELEAPSGWRDDMCFLHHLMDVYNYYQIHCRFPLVHFHALPNLSSACWNRRASFALLAYILIPAKRLEMKCVCDILCGKWGTYWFSDQKYNETSFEELSIAFANYPKALSTLTKYWSRDKSSMDIERSNRCAERAVYQAKRREREVKIYIVKR